MTAHAEAPAGESPAEVHERFFVPSIFRTWAVFDEVHERHFGPLGGGEIIYSLGDGDEPFVGIEVMSTEEYAKPS